MIKPDTPAKLADKHAFLSNDLHLNLETIEATLELNHVPRPALIEDTHEILKEVDSSLDALQSILLHQRAMLEPNSRGSYVPKRYRIERLELELSQNFAMFEEHMGLLYRALGMVKNQTNLVATSRAYVSELKRNINATVKALYTTLRDRGME